MLSDFIQERYGSIIREYEEQHQKDQAEKQMYQEQHQKDQEQLQEKDEIIQRQQKNPGYGKRKGNNKLIIL